MSYQFIYFFLNYDVWNRVTWNCLMSWASVSRLFRVNVRSAIDVEFIMQMKSCGNAKCSILEAWKDFCPQ
jgi:ABC-type dipeptide/oligopeptide/nickel transport system permease subunit